MQNIPWLGIFTQTEQREKEREMWVNVANMTEWDGIELNRIIE